MKVGKTCNLGVMFELLVAVMSLASTMSIAVDAFNLPSKLHRASKF